MVWRLLGEAATHLPVSQSFVMTRPPPQGSGDLLEREKTLHLIESCLGSCFPTLSAFCYLQHLLGDFVPQSGVRERPYASTRCSVENGSLLCLGLCLLGSFSTAQASTLPPPPNFDASHSV